jgi:hypothetical protein
MGVVRVDVLCECDGCGARFGVEVERAETLRDHDDFDALVARTIRRGNCDFFKWGVRGKATVDRLSLTYPATIQADLMLCDVCSRKCDDFPVEGNLTRTQVNEALGLPTETT